MKESYTITLQGEETLDNHKVILLELLPKTDEVKRQLSKIQLWLDESTWLPAQQQFYETWIGRLFHHPLQEYRAQRADSRFAVQTALAARHHESATAGITLFCAT